MKNKIAVVLFAALLVLSAASCGKKESNVEQPVEEKEEVAEEEIQDEIVSEKEYEQDANKIKYQITKSEDGKYNYKTTVHAPDDSDAAVLYTFCANANKTLNSDFASEMEYSLVVITDTKMISWGENIIIGLNNDNSSFDVGEWSTSGIAAASKDRLNELNNWYTEVFKDFAPDIEKVIKELK